MPKFQGHDWTHTLDLNKINTEALHPIQFTNPSSPNTLLLGARKELENGATILSIYYPYWMVNYTGLNLSYKGASEESIVTHGADTQGPVLFAFAAKTYSKNKALFKIGESDWSDEMNLDAAMTSVFICKGADRDYSVCSVTWVSISIRMGDN